MYPSGHDHVHVKFHSLRVRCLVSIKYTYLIYSNLIGTKKLDHGDEHSWKYTGQSVLAKKSL